MNDTTKELLRETVRKFLRRDSNVRLFANANEIAKLIRFHEGDSDKNPYMVSTCNEFYRDLENVYPYRYHLTVHLRVCGIRTSVMFPLARHEKGELAGRHISDHWYPHSLLDLERSLETHRNRKPFPFPLDDEKRPVCFLSSGLDSVHFDNRGAEWSTPARPIAAINALLKSLGMETLSTKSGNALLAELDEILEQSKPCVQWIEELPSEVYSSEGETAFTSCMTGEPPCYFQLYDELHHKRKLQMIEIRMDGRRVGRAIVWFGTNPDDSYLDRVYAPGHRSTFDSSVVKAVMEFCVNNGIQKTVHAQTAQWFGLAHVSRFILDTEGLTPDSFSYFPYVDSLSFFGYDGRLYSFDPGQRNTRCAHMQNTDGTADGLDNDDDDDYVTLANGEREHRDNVTYIPSRDEYYLDHECSYSSFLGEAVLDDESVMTYDGNLIWEEDSVELHDGTHARDNDSGLVMLLDGSYALLDRHELIELHDGNYVLADGDEAIVELCDGGYALVDDCVEVDGVWYLEGEQPES